MPEAQLAVYGKDFAIEELKTFMDQDAFPDFSTGYVILELFGENVFCGFRSVGALEGLVDDMISARFFDGRRQLKCRRITDGIIRAAADFRINDWGEPDSRVYTTKERRIALWGYRNSGLGGLYEERIPYVFKYPAEKQPEERGRLALTALEFQDGFGRPVWVRYTGLEKWEV